MARIDEKGNHRRKASPVDVNDAHIAGIATDLGEPVLTDNVSDFEELGVDVEEY
ncbi:hypothetical protein NDI76_16000 [Halogeometricum sp. S1BR25-6]|uniref:PIN domain-containing protein n=1 Tax=Halogeometricum salsisoli TaxID=2950536 RepID=A0ABU2GHG2_9EURY|nr:hypothetical protein [Halogeometricum sp. S1BR25-6]MDS0300250.1 hypothetical protein [Halogeometricum sp. S1BR25-6]